MMVCNRAVHIPAPLRHARSRILGPGASALSDCKGTALLEVLQKQDGLTYVGGQLKVDTADINGRRDAQEGPQRRQESVEILTVSKTQHE